ncbi:ABC transporter permease [Roseiterribacter gracilis]|uniref:Spermidine/putrescine ABC transporter permease n=1 Tax=Roseiterribacter gracilis TaxID=2812848 RepID=A0A8S8XDD6_9PROT|nr:spermidine/putrescine ABC transporter permease [Rhodospirillales bacterium TMPK1]
MNARTRGLLLLTPATLFVFVAFLVPLAILLAGSFQRDDGAIGLQRYVEFFADPLHQEVVLRTLRIGALVTLAAIALGYVAALAIVDLSPTSRARLVGLVTLPIMISPVARTYAWIVLLGRTGLVNNLALQFGLTDAPLRFLYTEPAVFVGLLQLLLPLMILSLVSALENVPRDAVPAARMLGANWWVVFTRVLLPLTRDGLATGGVLVFTGAITAYITPAMLGGAKILMLETLLYQRVNVTDDIATATVITALLVSMSILAKLVLSRLAKGRSK